MDIYKCDECSKEFKAYGKYESIPTEDIDSIHVLEQTVCDIIEGQYTEWLEVRCPGCDSIVAEYGR